MQNIADALSISKNTVSIALNNKPGVSEALREKVLKAAISMNYAGYGQLRGAADTLTVLVTGPEYVFKDLGFYHRMLGGVEQHGRASRVHVLISSISDEMQAAGELPRVLTDLHVSGILIVGTLDERYVRSFLALGTPVVSLDQAYESLPVDAVTSANAEGARDAVRHLVAAGHRRIGYIGPRGLTSSFRDRWFGYQSALLEAGLSPEKDICLSGSFVSLSTFPAFEGLAADLGRVRRFPTALFCANDSIAIFVMHWLSESGKRVPEDVSVVGFDDMENVEHLRPPLTTMAVHRERMGRKALDLLLARMRDSTEPVTRVVVQAELKVRGSSMGIPLGAGST
jgi:LacI family transcriptional regulator/LacI family purine nucleotide synthesis repressor